MQYYPSAFFKSSGMKSSSNVQLNKRQRVRIGGESVNVHKNDSYEHRENYSLIRNILEVIEEIDETVSRSMYIQLPPLHTRDDKRDIILDNSNREILLDYLGYIIIPRMGIRVLE